MDRILSVGILQDLLKARNEALKSAGFEVSSCAGTAHAKWLFRKHRHAVVVIGDAVPVAERNQLAAYVRRTAPQTQIIFLYAGRAEQTRFADAIVNVEEGPAYIVQTVQYLLRKQARASESTTSNGALPGENPVPKLLCIAISESALILRKKSLLEAGFQVTGALNLKEIEASCRGHNFDLIMVGPNIGPRMKISIANLLRDRCPEVPILEMGRVSPEIQGAHSVVGDSPAELVQAVRLILHRETSKNCVIG
jgi:DNA-binding response OmpR family regulator